MKTYIRIGPNIPQKDRHFIPSYNTLDDDGFSMYVESPIQNIGKMLYNYINSPGINSTNVISIEIF